MKVCLMCGENKADNEFYKIKDKRMKSGVRLHSYCKKCKLYADKEWRKTHIQEIASYRELHRGGIN